MRALIVPVVIIVLAIPMALQVVPRNSLYGFRTAHTQSSDAVWYHANKVAGIAFLAAGLLWLAIALAAPRVALLYGLAALAVALAASFWFTHRS